jgi:hypothetical protein
MGENATRRSRKSSGDMETPLVYVREERKVCRTVSHIVRVSEQVSGEESWYSRKARVRCKCKDQIICDVDILFYSFIHNSLKIIGRIGELNKHISFLRNAPCSPF